MEWNRKHGIVPHAVRRAINESAYVFKAAGRGGAEAPAAQTGDLKETIAELTREMLEAADNLEFERAAYLRDEIRALKKGR